MSSINPLKAAVDTSVAPVRSARSVVAAADADSPAKSASASSQAAAEHTAAATANGRGETSTPASATTAPEPVAAAEPITSESLQKQMDALLAKTQTALQFRVDEEAERLVVSVVDQETGDILLQIPGEVALRIARSLAVNGQGLVNVNA